MRPFLILVLTIFLINNVCANPELKKNENKKTQSEKIKIDKSKAKINNKVKIDQPVVTHHTIKIRGEEVTYKATTGKMILKSSKDKERASVFYIAYTVEPINGKKRPLTFSFNGGPGSSSVWMHMAMIGPRRVLMDDSGLSLMPPAELVDNEFSILDKTDLIFIDPVGTGFSETLGETNKKEFHGVNQDISSVGEFIRLYILNNEKWLSPKFLIGESYGTFRAAGLSDHLFGKYGIRLNGIMLISSILNFQTISFHNENDQVYCHFLPSYAATAWYHKKCAKRYQQMDLTGFLKVVEEFTTNEYTKALYAGTRLQEREKNLIAEQLSLFIGIDKNIIKQSDLRIPMYSFNKELLRSEGKTVGRFDSRYKGTDSNIAGSHAEYDPSFTEIVAPITTTLNHYLRHELNYKNDKHYNIMGGVHPWDFNAKNSYTSMTHQLARTINKNKHMKIFIASGLYDLATPYFATEYTFSHMSLKKEQLKNINIKYYEAGHMMYLHKPSLIKINNDLNFFIQNSIK